MPDPFSTEPANDVGTDTLDRFHYQALVTLPFCLECALGGDIESVIPEHLEDVALHCSDRWRFLQVKSRDPERGLWGLADLLPRGGALRSLYRTHNLTRDVTVSLELLLEGATRRDDPIEYLKEGGDRGQPDLVSRVAAGLNISAGGAEEFLMRVTLGPHPPPRRSARAQNILLLQDHAPDLAAGRTHSLHDDLIREIERAMRAEEIGPSWPRYVIHPSQGRTEGRRRLEVKRLSREVLRRIISPLTRPLRPLLRRLTTTGGDTMSPLEQKLVAGGAPEPLIVQARRLRANAQVQRLTLESAELYGREDLLEDLELRLETYAVSRRVASAGDAIPAPMMWNKLLGDLTNYARAIDPHNVFGADPLLLMGHACELSDRCVFDWGLTSV